MDRFYSNLNQTLRVKNLIRRNLLGINEFEKPYSNPILVTNAVEPAHEVNQF